MKLNFTSRKVRIANSLMHLLNSLIQKEREGKRSSEKQKGISGSFPHRVLKFWTLFSPNKTETKKNVTKEQVPSLRIRTPPRSTMQVTWLASQARNCYYLNKTEILATWCYRNICKRKTGILASGFPWGRSASLAVPVPSWPKLLRRTCESDQSCAAPRKLCAQLHISFSHPTAITGKWHSVGRLSGYSINTVNYQAISKSS